MNLSVKQKITATLFSVILLFLFGTTNSKATNVNITIADTTHEKIFAQVEMPPQFPGGIENFGVFLGQNIHYPADDAKNKIQGRVICTFIVEKDGTLSNIKALRSPTEAMAKEALRVLALSPVWKPGYQNGKLVRVAYTVPINFSLGSK